MTTYIGHATIEPLGAVTLYSDGKALIGLSLPTQKYDVPVTEEVIEKTNLPIFKSTITWLQRYCQGKNPGKLPFIRLIGTDFRVRVWQALLDIPYGKLVTYGDLTKKIYKDDTNKSLGARAIGGAVGHNPIPVIVPCHRVIGANNNLTGYTGGIDVKVKLLNLEGIDTAQYKLPKA